MAEHIRTVQIQVEIDTNKTTHKQSFALNSDETVEEFLARALPQARLWIETTLEELG